MEYEIRLYQDEDGIWIAECPSIPGCVSQGTTDDEASANISLAIKDCIVVRKELGMPPVVQHRIIRVSA